MKIFPPFMIALVYLQSTPAAAQAKPDDLAVERIHSPLPLYTFAWLDLWPRSFDSPDAIAGCESRVAFGDWKYEPNASNVDDEPSWFRFENYGVFHCAAIIQSAEAQAEISGGPSEMGFFVRLGKTIVKGKPLELWAIQRGFVPGSDYVLLARSGDDGSVVRSFIMLQQICLKDDIRELPESFDIFLTRYCSVETRSELLAMAKRMAKLKSIGTLILTPTQPTASQVEIEPTELPDAAEH